MSDNNNIEADIFDCLKNGRTISAEVLKDIHMDIFINYCENENNIDNINLQKCLEGTLRSSADFVTNLSMFILHHNKGASGFFTFMRTLYMTLDRMIPKPIDRGIPAKVILQKITENAEPFSFKNGLVTNREDAMLYSLYKLADEKSQCDMMCTRSGNKSIISRIMDDDINSLFPAKNIERDDEDAPPKSLLIIDGSDDEEMPELEKVFDINKND